MNVWNRGVVSEANSGAWVAGTRDCKHLLHVFAVVNLVSAAVHANILESQQDAKMKTDRSKCRRLQAG